MPKRAFTYAHGNLPKRRNVVSCVLVAARVIGGRARPPPPPCDPRCVGVVASDLHMPSPDGELEEGELEDGEVPSDDFVDDIAVSAAVPSARASELPGFGRV